MMTLDAGLGEPISVRDLEAKLKSFEREYGMSTEQLLARYSNALDPLAGVPAYRWYRLYTSLERLRVEENQPLPPWLDEASDENKEDPKGSSLFSLRSINLV